MRSLTEALDIMDLQDDDGKPVPFSIAFWTADEKRNTGGELISLPSVIRRNSANDVPEKKFSSGSKGNAAPKKDPNHSDNATRNIYLPESQRVITVHIYLIDSINGEEVVW